MLHRLALALVPFVLFAPLAHAHPGAHHGDFWAGIVHLLTEPDHLALIGLALLVGVFGYRRLRQPRTRK